MDISKLLKEDRTLKELYNAGLRYNSARQGYKILSADGAQYYFTKNKGLYHFEFLKPKGYDYYNK